MRKFLYHPIVRIIGVLCLIFIFYFITSGHFSVTVKNNLEKILFLTSMFIVALGNFFTKYIYTKITALGFIILIVFLVNYWFL